VTAARWSFRFGARGWWFVCRGYDTVELMRAAAAEYGGRTAADFGRAEALFQYRNERPANRCAGIVRLPMLADTDGEYDAEAMVHELVHAACRLYRLTLTNGGPVHLGWQCGSAEEDFAHIYDELWSSFNAGWVALQDSNRLPC
jgi:hypothetical protein